jgi:hypothetical protein
MPIIFDEKKKAGIEPIVQPGLLKRSNFAVWPVFLSAPAELHSGGQVFIPLRRVMSGWSRNSISPPLSESAIEETILLRDSYI